MDLLEMDRAMDVEIGVHCLLPGNCCSDLERGDHVHVFHKRGGHAHAIYLLLALVEN